MKPEVGDRQDEPFLVDSPLCFSSHFGKRKMRRSVDANKCDSSASDKPQKVIKRSITTLDHRSFNRATEIKKHKINTKNRKDPVFPGNFRKKIKDSSLSQPAQYHTQGPIHFKLVILVILVSLNRNSENSVKPSKPNFLFESSQPPNEIHD